MASALFDLFRQAVAQRKQVVCTYSGYVREVCPHAVGYKHNRERVMAYQFAGGSSKGLQPGGEWRCLDIADVSSASVRDGPWHTHPRHSRPNTCIDLVIEEVSH